MRIRILIMVFLGSLFFGGIWGISTPDGGRTIKDENGGRTIHDPNHGRFLHDPSEGRKLVDHTK